MSVRRIALIAVPPLAAVAGAGLIWWAAKMSAYTDAERAAELMSPLHPESLTAWDAAMDQIRTAKWRLHGIGFGLILLAGALVLATLRFRLWRPGSFARITTPRSRWAFLLLTAAIWIGLGVASTFDLVQDHYRGDVHPSEDAAERSLPGVMVLLFVCMGLSMASKLMTLHRAALPVMLWTWNGNHRGASWLLTVVYGFEAAIVATFSLVSAFNGDWVAIPLLLGVYSVLSMRAVRVAEGRAHRLPGRYAGGVK